MEAAREVMPKTGKQRILCALGLSRATFFRHGRPRPSPRPKVRPARALAPHERQEVLNALHSPAFMDRAPAEVFHTLSQQGTYLCSQRTMYRILASNQEVRERRNQARHPEYARPELVATVPNQVWSWDITKLRLMKTFSYAYLYVILDIYSRFALAWMLAEHENSRHATRLIDEAVEREGVQPQQLVLHSDRGGPMRALTTAQLLGVLGVTASFSRPHVSDDNPYSESQFKTLKYHPGFPSRFASFHEANTFCASFFNWYNHEHHHAGIAYLTPAQVHHGHADRVLDLHHATLTAAYERNPERFVHGPPARPRLPPAVYINQPKPLEVTPPGPPTQKTTQILSTTLSQDR